MKEIILKFDLKTGQAKIEAQGFKGSTCTEATRFLKEALGNVTDYRNKAEYFETSLEVTGTVRTDLCG
jgi:hypothetical protein